MTEPEDDRDDDEHSDAEGIAAALIALGGMEPEEAVRVAEDLEAKYKAAMEEWGEAGRILEEKARRSARHILGVASPDEPYEPPAERIMPRLIARARAEAEAAAQAQEKTEAEAELARKLPADWLQPRGKQTLN